MAIVDVNQLLDEELGPAPKKPAALDVNQLMDEELGMRMAMPPERPTKPQVSRPAPTSMPSEDRTPAPSQEAYRGIGQALKDTAISSMDLAVAMLPGAGSMEAGGAGVENPVSAALNLEEARPIPSMAEDIEEGRNLDATFKGLGVAGDIATAGGLTMMATGAGMIPGAFLTAGGVGMKAVSKYGDEIADGLRKLFDVDKDAAMKAAERADEFVAKDLPMGAALNMIKAETKKAKGPIVKPRVSAPVRDLGLFSRAEEAVLNMDIPKDGISGRALMKKLRDDPDVPNDELDYGLGLLVKPDDMLTREQLEEYLSKSFGIRETVRRGADTVYGESNRAVTQYRLPDADDSNYTEITYHVKPIAQGSNETRRLNPDNQIRNELAIKFDKFGKDMSEGGFNNSAWGEMASEDAFEELMEYDRFAEFVEELDDDSIFNIDRLENLGEEFFGQRAAYEQAVEKIDTGVDMWLKAYELRFPALKSRTQRLDDSKDALPSGYDTNDARAVGEVLKDDALTGQKASAANFVDMLLLGARSDAGRTVFGAEVEFDLEQAVKVLRHDDSIRIDAAGRPTDIDKDVDRLDATYNVLKELMEEKNKLTTALEEGDMEKVARLRVQLQDKLIKRIVKAQSKYRASRKLGARPLEADLSPDEIALQKIVATFENRGTLIPKSDYQTLVKRKGRQARTTLGEGRRYFSDVRINPGENNDELAYVFRESADVAQAGVQYRETRHFSDDPINTFVHARTSDRVTTDGKKVLVVEEIQSDLNKESASSLSRIQLPFKNKNYQAFAVARLTKRAVDEGYDGVIFLTGAEQARRNENGVESVIDSIVSVEVENPGNMIPPTPDREMPIVKQINIINPEGDNIFDGLVDTETGRYIPGTNSTDDRMFLEQDGDGNILGKELTQIVPSKDTVKRLLDEDTTVEVGDMVLDETGYKTLYDVAIPKRLRQIVDRTKVTDKPEVRKMDIEVGRQGVDSELWDSFDAREMVSVFDDLSDNDGTFHMTRRMQADDSGSIILGLDQMKIYNADHPFDEARLHVVRNILDIGARSLIDGNHTNFSVGRAMEEGRRIYLNNPERHKYVVMQLDDAVNDAGNMMFPDSGGIDFDPVAAERFVASEIVDEDELLENTKNMFQRIQLEAELSTQTAARTVTGNNGIYFTEEFKKHVSEMGLPRMRKGGLVSPK